MFTTQLEALAFVIQEHTILIRVHGPVPGHAERAELRTPA